MRLLALLVTTLAVAGFLAGCAAEEEMPVEETEENTSIEETVPPEEPSDTRSETTAPPTTTNLETAQVQQMVPSPEEEAVREREPAPAETGISTTQTAAPNPATVGQPLTFTITVKNNSVPQSAGLKAFLPPSVSLVSALPSQGVCATGHHDDNTVECPLGVVASGASVTIEVVVVPTVPGSMTNTASAQGESSPATPANITSATVAVNPAAPGSGVSEAHGAH